MSVLLDDNFTVMENGKPKRIVAVTEMALGQDPPPSAWLRMVRPICSRTIDDMGGRGSSLSSWRRDIPSTPRDHLNSRAVGRYLVDALSPSDVRCDLFAAAGRTQDFTPSEEMLAAMTSSSTEVKGIESRRWGPVLRW